MNALRTFKTFMMAAETPEVRQTILLETTHAIFGSTPTGFLPASKDKDTDGSPRLLDALTKLSKTGSGS